MNSPEQNPTRPCAICASQQNRLLFVQKFSQMSTGSLLSGYHVVACTQCGFTFSDRIPEQSYFDIYYRDMSKYEDSVRVGSESPYERARFHIIAEFLERSIPSKQAHILEVGCATGQLLALLKEKGFENVLGVDPSPRCAEIAQQQYGVRVLTNTLSDMAVPQPGADFIILVGVLEHVRDLAYALGRLRSSLAEIGLIFISVPDASRYVEGEDAPYQEFSVEHINYFSPSSLTNLMQVNGFKPVACEQADITPSFRTTTPVIFGVYQKSQPVAPQHLAPDAISEAALSAYIEKSRREDDLVRQTIDILVTAQQPVIVWGTGAHTLRLLASSRLSEAIIHRFVDSNPRYQGKDLNGTPIIAPAELHNYPIHAILISSRVYQQEIVQTIRGELGLNNPLITLYDMKSKPQFNSA